MGVEVGSALLRWPAVEPLSMHDVRFERAFDGKPGVPMGLRGGDLVIADDASHSFVLADQA